MQEICLKPNKNKDKMTTEKELTLVSFELAELLKKAGFDWRCKFFYLLRTKKPLEGELLADYNNVLYSSAPTLDLAQKWLRDVHNISLKYTTQMSMTGGF